MALHKDSDHFPHRQNLNFQAYCSVSPLSKPAADRIKFVTERQLQVGRGMIFEFAGEEHVANRFHRNFGQLLKTSADDITMLTNTSEGIWRSNYQLRQRVPGQSLPLGCAGEAPRCRVGFAFRHRD